MNGIHLLSLIRGKNEVGNINRIPAIFICANWMRSIGFVDDALVQFFPEEYGGMFRLCNDNIASYSELSKQTKEKGGMLTHSKMREHNIYPSLTVTGSIVCRTGLVFDDNLIVRYEFGLVHFRKLPDKHTVVNSRVFGKWLSGVGFEYEAVITVASEPGIVICLLQEDGIARTAELVKYARANDINLLQVQKVQGIGTRATIPEIDIPQSRFIKAGLSPDDNFLASYEYGRIQLQKLDFAALGF